MNSAALSLFIGEPKKGYYLAKTLDGHEIQ
jgi:hypothetical protein